MNFTRIKDGLSLCLLNLVLHSVRFKVVSMYFLWQADKVFELKIAAYSIISIKRTVLLTVLFGKSAKKFY